MEAYFMFLAVIVFAKSTLSGWAPHHSSYHGPLAAPAITPSGYLAETPEVAAAKASHLSELARASGHVPFHAPTDAGYSGLGYSGAYHGPLARPVVTPSGYLADTPEVAAAKATHMSLLMGASRNYGPAAHFVPYATPFVPTYAAPRPSAYPTGYDGGRYKGEGAYSNHYDDAKNYDDGSYKPHLYENRHY